MMADEITLAPVTCQPSLPFSIGKDYKSALGISDVDLNRAKARASTGQKLLGFRFTGDKKCPAAKFDRLRLEFEEMFDETQIDSGPDNAHGIDKKAHAVLTKNFTDDEGHPTSEALQKVFDFFKENLPND